MKTATSFSDSEDMHEWQSPMYPQADTGRKEREIAQTLFFPGPRLGGLMVQETLPPERLLKSHCCLVP